MTASLGFLTPSVTRKITPAAAAVSPYQLALPKFVLANIPPNINILPAVWGEI